MSFQQRLRKSDDDFAQACVDQVKRDALIERLTLARKHYGKMGIGTLLSTAGFAFLCIYSPNWAFGPVVVAIGVLQFSAFISSFNSVDSEIKFLKGLAALQSQFRDSNIG